ncbi:glycosyl hydrolases family 31-domain-containing protein [Apiosordaria backusii]|uniref:alpha-glucosidase n=1 Tax=Apiosordaria backusii TaxID=314023 RepID=A0AA40K1D0_9PEZI|nr:glycosyl hydrolases family 31-domain-containing protein [Apiosordaria backusii]
MSALSFITGAGRSKSSSPAAPMLSRSTAAGTSSSSVSPVNTDTMPDRYSFPSNPSANPKAIITGGTKGNHYRFTILTDRLIRYEWSPDGGFEDRVSTFALFRNFAAPAFRTVDKDNRLEIITDQFHLEYDKKKFSSSGFSVKVGNDEWRYDGNSYGDLGGTARTLDGAWGRVDLEPGVLSRRAYAVLDDSKSMLFDADGWIATRKPGRVDGYIFAYNGDHKAAIKDFYRLSGNQPVLPRWTLGNWWSRYHEYSAEEYIGLMDDFHKEGVPLSAAVIDMDWHKVHIPSKYGSGWTGYSWNRDLFPQPEKFLKQLHDRKLKVTVNDHPADGIRAFEDQYKEVAKALNHDTSHEEPIRFDCCSRKFLDAYFDVLKVGLEKQGIDFWWIDWQQGTRSRIPGVDPLWVLNHYHYLTSRRNVKTIERPITFSRYAGAGSHRYPIGFSGDTQISWAGLEFQPEFTATASNIGYGWWSHDIGGHWGGWRSNQLTVRWVQLGVFSPILRLHSTKSLWNSKEPWNFESYPSRIIKDFLVLRHRLIPYLYTMNIRAAYESEPLVQPMYWNHPHTEEAYRVPNQYYFGPNLIVAPITSPDDGITLTSSVKTWLPEGRFVSLFSPHIAYTGNRHIQLHRPLDQIPVLAKEGTIVPLDSTSTLSNGTPTPEEITVLLVVGKDARFDLLEEPPVPFRHHENPHDDPRKDFTSTPIFWHQKPGLLSIGPETTPYSRYHSNRLRHWKVKLIGYTATKAHLEQLASGYKVTEVDGSIEIDLGPVFRWNPHAPFEIVLGPELQLDVLDFKKQAFDRIHRAEGWYDDKDKIWNCVADTNSGSVQERVERLHHLNGVYASLKNSVMEVWAADERAEGTAYGKEIWTNTLGAEGRGELGKTEEEDWDDYVLV